MKNRPFHFTLFLAGLIISSCDWPFNPQPTDSVFSLEASTNITRIISKAPVWLSWDAISVENFRDFRIERRSVNDSSWISVAILTNPLVYTYIDSIADDEDLIYRVGIEDSLWNVRWAYTELTVPPTRFLQIPEDVDSLQKAYNSPLLDDGDTLFVGAGKYYGGFQFGGKDVHIIGTAGWDQTILDGQYTQRVVQISSGELVGFKILFGKTYFSTPGGGIYLSGNALVRNCFITGNLADGPGDGILITDNARLYNCLIVRNAGEGVVATNAHG